MFGTLESPTEQRQELGASQGSDSPTSRRSPWTSFSAGAGRRDGLGRRISGRKLAQNTQRRAKRGVQFFPPSAPFSMSGGIETQGFDEELT